jgi:hypothetical protein
LKLEKWVEEYVYNIHMGEGQAVATLACPRLLYHL